MSVEIRVPQLPESVADATLIAWRKQGGQSVSRDENLADLETDKVVLEVPAPVSGVLREIKVQSGTIGQERRTAGRHRRRPPRRLRGSGTDCCAAAAADQRRGRCAARRRGAERDRPRGA